MQLAITFEARNKRLVGETNVTVSRKSERHQIETRNMVPNIVP